MYFHVAIPVFKGHSHYTAETEKRLLTQATRRNITDGFRIYTIGSKLPVAQPAPYAPTLLAEDIFENK